MFDIYMDNWKSFKDHYILGIPLSPVAPSVFCKVIHEALSPSSSPSPCRLNARKYSFADDKLTTDNESIKEGFDVLLVTTRL